MHHLPSVSQGTTSEEGDSYGSRKRRRLSGGRPSTVDSSQRIVEEEECFPLEDPLGNLELYALADTIIENPLSNFGNLARDGPSVTGLRATTSGGDTFNSIQTDSDQPFQLPSYLDDIDPQVFFDLGALLPERSSRIIPIGIPNPFTDNAEKRIQSLDLLASFAPQNGEVNGYLKFKMLQASLQQERPSRRSLQYQSTKEKQSQCNTMEEAEELRRQRDRALALAVGKGSAVPKNPTNFGLNCKLRPVERKIFRFYIDAWCSGRTILTRTNSWKVDLGPMLPSSEPLRNALLAMACTYILDYSRDERLKDRANAYYSAAVRAVTNKMQDAREWEVGKGDDLVGTFVLLCMHDVVTWESRRATTQVARWLEGARTACKILDATDPGYRYYQANNVQVSSARIGNAINIARFAIFGLPFTPLDIEHTNKKKFGWLLYGTEAEVHRIHGASGYSRKLLHIWAQITHLAAKFTRNPDPDVIPVLGQTILDRISRLVQWSELSAGFESTEELLEACTTNAEGKIEEPWEMVALGAECWKQAAQIYLLCRLFRYPRTHPIVMARLDVLAECLSRMPCSGALFTSMTPLFPCFLLGMLSVEDRHRNVTLNWFNTVMKANQCRSCLAPTWKAINSIWRWTDTQLIDPVEIPDAIENRDPWWERLVARIMATEGTLCVL